MRVAARVLALRARTAAKERCKFAALNYKKNLKTSSGIGNQHTERVQNIVPNILRAARGVCYSCAICTRNFLPKKPNFQNSSCRIQNHILPYPGISKRSKRSILVPTSMQLQSMTYRTATQQQVRCLDYQRTGSWNRESMARSNQAVNRYHQTRALKLRYGWP